MTNNKEIVFICFTSFSLILGFDQNHENHRITMGVSDPFCDNGQILLENDWNGSQNDYKCNNPNKPLPVKRDNKYVEECDHLPEDYSPHHYCMKDRIIYDNILPTHGDHRPLWAKFGEYLFLPVQRWLHNAEHGAIVMLYHPCADKRQVSILREIVVKCIRKHIITPYNLLPVDKPFALVGWGCRLLLNAINNQTIISFIKRRGLNGPEGHLPNEGQYDHLLLKLAQAPPGSDIYDTYICPNM